MSTGAFLEGVQMATMAAQYQQKVGAPYVAATGAPFDRLRDFDAYLGGHVPLETLVELAAYGRSLAAEYLKQEIPPPKWLEPNLARLGREIKARYRREQERKLAAAEKELEELRSKEERRAAKEREIEALRHELGL